MSIADRPSMTRAQQRRRSALRVLVACAALCASAVDAHVVAYPREATAGGSVDLRLRVPHGCNGSPTVALRLKVPDGLTAVKPRLKPGWRISVTRRSAPPAAGTGPGQAAHGARGADAAHAEVDEVEWRGGPLPDDLYDDFELTARLPATPGRTLALPTVQECEQGLVRWIEAPAMPGQPEPEHPAPALRLR